MNNTKFEGPSQYVNLQGPNIFPDFLEPFINLSTIIVVCKQNYIRHVILKYSIDNNSPESNWAYMMA